MFNSQSSLSPINALATTSRLAGVVCSPSRSLAPSSTLLLRSISERATPSFNNNLAAPALPISPPLPSNRPAPPSKGPSPSKGLGINFYSRFSDIPSPEALGSILHLSRSITRAELAPLPPSTRERHIKLQAILVQASKMDSLTQKQFFESLDAEFVSREEVEAKRKEVARLEVQEGGKFDECDAGTMEEWDEAALVVRDKALDDLYGMDRKRMVKNIDYKMEKDRRETMARREVRREMKEVEEKEKKGIGLAVEDT